MVLSYQYYNSVGIPRWNLGWASPTYAGAFLCTVIPYAWGLQKIARAGSKPWRAGVFVLELALVFLLCKTQSRGALVALIVASAYWHLAGEKQRRWRRFGGKMILLAACVWIAGFSSRVEPGYVAKDLSIRNRFTLWKGCLKVFAMLPAEGGGAASSGRLYRAWFESPDRLGGYPTPINSYLFAAIEYPLPLATLVFALLILAVVAPFTGPDPGNSVGRSCAVAASASIVGWCIASIFSTLWDEYPLWIVPVISISAVIGSILRQRKIGLNLAVALGLTLAFEGAAKAVGWSLLEREKIAPRLIADGVTRLRIEHARPSAWPTCHIWLDDEVLGFAPEKELRRWLAVDGSPSTVIVHDRWADTRDDPRDGDVVILFGRSAERLFTSLNRKYARVILIHPRAPFHDALPLPANAVVVVPEIDQDGSLGSLRSAGSGRLTIVTPGVGADIRPAWPAVMNSIDRLYSAP